MAPRTFPPRTALETLAEIRPTVEKQQRANEVALEYLNKWLTGNGMAAVTMQEAHSGDRQSDIY